MLFRKDDKKERYVEDMLIMTVLDQGTTKRVQIA